MAISLEKIKEQLLLKIDRTDLIQVEKVEQYIHLLKTVRELNTEIINKKSGIEVRQLVVEINRIYSTLLTIEKSLGL